MEQKERHECSKCGQTYGVSFYDRNHVPEDCEEGYYCDDCIERLRAQWWAKEKNAYVYDNYGNHPDDPDYEVD